MRRTDAEIVDAVAVLVDQVREVSASDIATVYVADIERALGIRPPRAVPTEGTL